MPKNVIDNFTASDADSKIPLLISSTLPVNKAYMNDTIIKIGQIIFNIKSPFNLIPFLYDLFLIKKYSIFFKFSLALNGKICYHIYRLFVGFCNFLGGIIMKSTGIVRKMDELGRVVIPIEMRNQFKIAEKDPVEIYVEGSNIIIRKFQPSCIFCGNTKNVTEYKDKLVCNKCVKKLNEIVKD